MISGTDQHDIDKLGRWLRELTEPSSNSFPVSAVFLVSDAAQIAHDIFRAFRRSFEQRGAGFGNLIIFGQHGVSSTVQALLSRLSLPPDSIPLLLLLRPAGYSPAYILPLPAGSASGTISDGLTGPALELLSRVERFADRAAVAFDDSGITGLTEIPLPAADLVTLVRQLVGEIGQ
ncbi:MAG TPA: hypothetical protein VFR55_06740 [Dehalococcoidia bacterium]|nr:hypothetical protein [Dehalococcoidia bacterium]